MTEIDTAAIREYASADEDGDVYYTVIALCDALDEVRAEAARLTSLRSAEARDLDEAVRVQMEQRARAEEAEQLSAMHESVAAEACARLVTAERQVAAVRALCDDPPVPSRMLIAYIRAALDGAATPAASDRCVHGAPSYACNVPPAAPTHEFKPIHRMRGRRMVVTRCGGCEAPNCPDHGWNSTVRFTRPVAPTHEFSSHHEDSYGYCNVLVGAGRCGKTASDPIHRTAP